MWKKIVLLLLVILLFVSFLIARILRKEVQAKYTDVDVEIVDSINYKLLTNNDVLAMLSNAGLNPKGKSSDKINTDLMEQCLSKNGFIARAECYKTVSNAIRIKIYQRAPVFRIISSDGSYYMDANREQMPSSTRYAPYVPVVSGNVRREFAKKELFDFIVYIQKSSFWNAQIDQICVEGNDNIVLIPKVGDHEIILGKLDNYETKLDNLLLLYREVFNKVGWGKYKRINLKYDNQIVCTKR